MIKLYQPQSTLKTYYHLGWRYSNVWANWCVRHRKQSIMPYHEGIKDYDKWLERRANSDGWSDIDHQLDPKHVIDEYFTYQEALKLQECLQKAGEDCKLTDVSVPIDPYTYPLDHDYGNELNSMNCFSNMYYLVPAIFPFDIFCYCRKDESDRRPECDEFFITCKRIIEGHTCFYCEKPIVQHGYRYRILAALDGQYSVPVCRTCAHTYAPELGQLLDHFYKSDSAEYYLHNLAKEQQHNLGMFRIQYRSKTDNEKLPCAFCQNLVQSLNPYSIAYFEEYRPSAVCRKCANSKVPELVMMLDKFYELSLDQTFNRRFKKEQEAINPRIIKGMQ